MRTARKHNAIINYHVAAAAPTKIWFYVLDGENVKNKRFSFGVSGMYLNISQVLREMSCQRADFTLVATWQLLIRLDRSVPSDSVALTWFVSRLLVNV